MTDNFYIFINSEDLSSKSGSNEAEVNIGRSPIEEIGVPFVELVAKPATRPVLFLKKSPGGSPPTEAVHKRRVRSGCAFTFIQ
jgi:hypothetical protein